MKDMKKRLKNYGLWSAFFLGLVPLIAQASGHELPVEFPAIVNYALGFLVMLGLISDPADGEGFLDKGEKLFGKTNE